MQRRFTYTKERLSLIIRSLLEDDVLASAAYHTEDRAEEGFEKRAALEFLLWFLDQAFPENFSFQCDFDSLEEDYPEAIARKIADGKGWSAAQVREQDTAGNVVFVDFSDHS